MLKAKDHKKLPKKPGVYLFYDSNRTLLYIGKSVSLKNRVASYFQSPAKLTLMKQQLVEQIGWIDFKETDSEIEALILEAMLIKKHLPPYNIIWKDDKNYFWVKFTREEWPRVLLTHQNQEAGADYVGPFVDGRALKTVLRLLRLAFPYRTNCRPYSGRGCLHYHLGLCPGACALTRKDADQNADKRGGVMSAQEYKKSLRELKLVLQGKRSEILKTWQKELKSLSKEKNYEEASVIRDRILALQKVFAHSHVWEREQDIDDEWRSLNQLRSLRELLKLPKAPKRIECYDISHLAGKDFVGSMSVFTNGSPDLKNYRRFAIKGKKTIDDPAMLSEILQRRFQHKDWGTPDLIVLDGGLPQINIAGQFIPKNIPTISLAKREELIFLRGSSKTLTLRAPMDHPGLLLLRYLRDEAHRWAIGYQKRKRGLTQPSPKERA